MRSIWEHGWIEDRVCGCGAPFGGCRMWQPVHDGPFGGAGKADARERIRQRERSARTKHSPLMLTAPGRRWVGRRLGGYLGTLGRLYGAVRDVTGSSVIVDSSKFPSYGYALGMVPGVELYVLHLVRDPRAVAYSWLKKKVQPDLEGTQYMMQRSPAGSSLRWMARNLATEAFWRRSPGRYMMLRYEDFVRAPRETVGRIVGMLGEGDRRLPFVSEREAELGLSHTISGNPNRFDTGTIELRPDREWASKMRWRDRALVTLLTLPLLARYGYPVGGAG